MVFVVITLQGILDQLCRLVNIWEADEDEKGAE